MDAETLKDYNKAVIASLIRAGIADGMTIAGLSGLLDMCRHVFTLESELDSLKFDAKLNKMEIAELEDFNDCVCGNNREEY